MSLLIPPEVMQIRLVHSKSPYLPMTSKRHGTKAGMPHTCIRGGTVTKSPLGKWSHSLEILVGYTYSQQIVRARSQSSLGDQALSAIFDCLAFSFKLRLGCVPRLILEQIPIHSIIDANTKQPRACDLRILSSLVSIAARMLYTTKAFQLAQGLGRSRL